MRQFGLIGYPLTHSFSKGFFTTRFEAAKIAAVYENFPLQSLQLFPELLRNNPDLEGLNVTIPYKESIIPYLHRLSPLVEETGACNCIRIQNNQLTGFNTDVIGFEKSLLKKLGNHHRAALVLGTGGASKAVQYVLKKLQLPFTVISRNDSAQSNTSTYNTISAAQLSFATLWINTTPLGMFPDIETLPPLDYSLLTKNHYLYDLIYNPAETAFLKMGRMKEAVIENGQDMLYIQAEESYKIWNA
jgi:shikimate dehydrogenase